MPQAWQTRLTQWRKGKGLTQRQLAGLIREDPQFVNDLERRRKKIPPEIGELLAALGLDLNWLITGKGDPGAKEAPVIPVYDTGGGSSWRAAEDVEPYQLPVPTSLVGFRVRGDSMEPLARHGQVLVALPHTPPANGDLAYVELQDDTACFKRVYVRGSEWVLVSLNPASPPVIVKATEIRRAMKAWAIAL